MAAVSTWSTLSTMVLSRSMVRAHGTMIWDLALALALALALTRTLSALTAGHG